MNCTIVRCCEKIEDMPHFDPDSSTRKHFKLFEEQSNKSTFYTNVVTFLQIFLIFSVMRMYMIESGFAFFYIPVFDDLMIRLLGVVHSILKQVL